MEKYLPFVKVHCKGGDLDVFESGKPEYDTVEKAIIAGNVIRADMLQVDTDCNPTVFVLESK